MGEGSRKRGALELGGGVTTSVRSSDGDASSRQQATSSAKRVVYLAGAGACFGTGIVGLLLPGLPTTPFMLLTSYLLVRSSPRLNDVLLRSRVFGSILRDWQHHGGVRPAVKLRSIGVVLLTVSATLCFSSLDYPTLILAAAFATIGVLVILRLPSTRKP